MTLNTDPVIVTETYPVPAADVWNAITNLDQMKEWFFAEIPEFKPEQGFEIEFIVHCEGTDYPHQWKLTEVVPEQRIVYDWRYGGFAGDSTVTWELTELEGGTQLKVTHAGGHTFPQDNPIFSRESGIEGWQYFLQESLKDYLAK